MCWAPHISRLRSTAPQFESRRPREIAVLLSYMGHSPMESAIIGLSGLGLRLRFSTIALIGLWVSRATRDAGTFHPSCSWLFIAVLLWCWVVCGACDSCDLTDANRGPRRRRCPALSREATSHWSLARHTYWKLVLCLLKPLP